MILEHNRWEWNTKLGFHKSIYTWSVLLLELLQVILQRSIETQIWQKPKWSGASGVSIAYWHAICMLQYIAWALRKTNRLDDKIISKKTHKWLVAIHKIMSLNISFLDILRDSTRYIIYTCIMLNKSIHKKGTCIL